jgi:hypothetical protein
MDLGCDRNQNKHHHLTRIDLLNEDIFEVQERDMDSKGGMQMKVVPKNAPGTA